MLQDLLNDESISSHDAVKLLSPLQYTIADLDKYRGKNDVVYAQALNLLALKSYDPTAILKLCNLKSTVLNSIHTPSRTYAKNRLVPVMPSESSSYTLNYSTPSKVNITDLIKLLLKDVSIKSTSELHDVAAKLSSSSSHKYGFVLFRNISKVIDVEYRIDHLVNKSINYTNGLHRQLISDFETIRLHRLISPKKASIEIYNKSFVKSARCFYYYIDTSDDSSYIFLGLPGSTVLAYDALLQLHTYNPLMESYNNIVCTELIRNINPDLLRPIKFRHNKYNIDYNDMATHITEKLLQNYGIRLDKVDIADQLIEAILKYLSEYISVHVSALNVHEILSVFLSEKTKLKRLLIYDIKLLLDKRKNYNDIEINVQLHTIIFNAFNNSRIFDLLYFKEISII